MSKAGFRRIDVDQYDEENFKDEQVEQNAVGPDEAQVSQFLLGGNNIEALKTSLKSPPYRSKSAEKALNLVIRVITSIKTNDIPKSLQSLSSEDLDTLLKYVYKGFSASLDGQQCACLLSWHEKIVAKGGMGCVIRVLTDRKRL